MEIPEPMIPTALTEKEDPKNNWFKAESLDPNRPVDRTDNDDESVNWPMIEAFWTEAIIAAPRIDTEELHLINDLRDKVLPKLKQFSTDKPLDNRAWDRIEKQEPMVMWESTEAVSPIFEWDNTEHEEDRRAKDLKLNVDPIATIPRMLKLLENLAADLIDNELAHWANPKILTWFDNLPCDLNEKLLPSCKASKTDACKPTFIDDLTDKELPRFTEWNIEIHDPTLTRLRIETVLPAVNISRRDAEPPTLRVFLVDTDEPRAHKLRTEHFEPILLPLLMEIDDAKDDICCTDKR